MIASISIVVGLSDAVATAAAATTVVVPPGMATTTTLSGLPGFPTAVEFAPDGRIYVAIKDGRVLMYHGPGDTTPVVTLDIPAAVNNYGDRGLLGIALDPAFTTGRPARTPVPGQPITAGRLGARLGTPGIDARAGRRSALIQLAAELPAAVLADTLDITIATPATGSRPLSERNHPARKPPRVLLSQLA